MKGKRFPEEKTIGVLKESVGAQWELRCRLVRTDQRFRRGSGAS